jgi:hypothetical protein
MRAHTEGKYEMGKRFAIVIGVAAAGVMALGAQTAAAGGEPVDSVKPDLQLSGPKKVSLHPEVPGQGRPWVLVKASCGKVKGPPASPLESVPPEPWAANLPDTACTLSAEGKVMGDELKPLDELHPPEGDLLGPPQVFCVPDLTTCHWQSGGTLYLNLKLTKKTLKQARKALDAGKKVRAKVTVEATDAAGNVAIAKRTIRLVK